MEPAAQEAQPEQNQAPAGDTVEISSDGRRRLAELADTARAGLDAGGSDVAESASTDDLRQERILLARMRMKSGYYNQSDVKKQIADVLAGELFASPPDEPEASEQT